jgi:hypothetical protein
LSSFGEVRTVTEKPGPTIASKLVDWGMSFVSYARNYAWNLYMMIKMKTGKVLITGGIQLYKRFIGEFKTRYVKDNLFDVNPIK